MKVIEEIIQFLKSEGAVIKHSNKRQIELDELKINLFDLNKVDKIPSCKSQSVNVRVDQWENDQEKIKSKLKDRLGNNQRVFGRNCIIESIEAPVAQEFLGRFHLLGFTKAKHHYGIFEKNQLLGVASFGKKCPIDRYGEKSISSELKRLCFIPGITVIGGFTKVLRYHINKENLDDIMTYLDRNWSTGENFEDLGFYEDDRVKNHFYFDSEENKIYLPSEMNDQMQLKRIEGAGSIKMLYYDED